ncbi:MAG: DMT family transporter, partial [Deferribacterota bacterium]|nr:DMT family transporter [Deferribacterota bacterium]
MKFSLKASDRFYESIADISLLLVSLCWGSTFVIIKIALNEVSVLDFLFLRFLLATFCMLPLFIVKYKYINIKSIGAGIFLGILLFLLFAYQTIGIAYTKSAEAAFITGSYIIYTPIFSVLILKKKPYKSSIIGVLLAFIGLLVMTLRWKLNLSVGELYLILNAIFLALHII